MTQEYLIILIASVLTAILITVLLTWIITRLVILKNHEPKVSLIAAQAELNALKNEYASTVSRLDMLQENHDQLNKIAALRLEEIQDLNSGFATAVQQAENLQEVAEKLSEQLHTYKLKWEHSSKELIEKTNTLSRIKAEQEAQQQRFLQQEQNLLNIETKMGQTFELLAGQTLEAKTTAFKTTQAEEFTHLLAPLKQ